MFSLWFNMSWHLTSEHLNDLFFKKPGQTDDTDDDIVNNGNGNGDGAF